MDLSRITRPSVLCQCSRCSSSLAACENEWAKLSNSYSIAAGWLSVDINRIAVSPERKQIPLSSDLSLLRGRILQEITCKLCEQKLGALCALDHGANVFWKMSKVSFREIVTMRTVDPIFKDDAVDSVLYPQQNGDGEPEPDRGRPPTASGSPETAVQSSSVRHQIQSQGMSISRISSSVDNLHGTMTELKNAFTALRIELHGPSRHPSEPERADGSFDMIATVLKELRSKSDEVDRLRLENEALKLKNRYLEERPTRPSPVATYLLEDSALTEVRGPRLLNENGKRPWPETQQNGCTRHIADSFDEEHELSDAISVDDITIHSVKIPLNDGAETGAVADVEQTTPRPQLRVEVHGKIQDSSTLDAMTEAIHNTHLDPQQSANKRPRLSQTGDSRPPSSAGPEKRKPGRPRGRRKSINQTMKPTPPETPNPAPLREQDINISAVSQRESGTSNSTPNDLPSSKPRGRPLRGRSRPSSVSPAVTRAARNADAEKDGNTSAQGRLEHAVEVVQPGGANGESMDSADNIDGQSEKENPEEPASENSEKEEVREKRKAQVAARDLLAKMAMQREEAMATEE